MNQFIRLVTHKINGKWYYPAIDYKYDEIGIASWYGPGFHGKKTAKVKFLIKMLFLLHIEPFHYPQLSK